MHVCLSETKLVSIVVFIILFEDFFVVLYELITVGAGQTEQRESGTRGNNMPVLVSLQ